MNRWNKKEDESLLEYANKRIGTSAKSDAFWKNHPFCQVSCLHVLIFIFILRKTNYRIDCRE